jgi:xylulokinase
MALTTTDPVLDPEQRTFSFLHLNPDLFVAIGTMQAAGGAFDWLERLLRPAESTSPRYRELDEQAESVPVGSNRLLFLPYLLGERSPHWNPLARGAFVGLAMSHGKAEMTRAVLEGVTFNLRHILDVLRSQGVEVEVMRLIGGGGKSALWRQILADVYGLPVAHLGLSAEATALGAAIAGGVGVGIYADYTVARELAPVVGYDDADADTSERYKPYYELFKKTYEVLAPIYTELGALPV